jgi:hypothetical protein
MTQELVREPIYGKIWNQIKKFPRILAEGNDRAPTVSGPAAAAFVSAAIGCFTMMVTHHISDGDKSKTVEKIVHSLGAWIPGSHNPDPMWGNIGSYTGKETMLLVGWLVSWVVLGNLWKDKNIKAKTMLFWFFTLIIAATAMSWHPLFPYLPLT